jgi:tRNA(Ile2) C34 agmatinyltransferase TiaS
MADDTKVCPVCGETIKSIVIKCKYCGGMLDSVSVETLRSSVDRGSDHFPRRLHSPRR